MTLFVDGSSQGFIPGSGTITTPAFIQLGDDAVGRFQSLAFYPLDILSSGVVSLHYELTGLDYNARQTFLGQNGFETPIFRATNTLDGNPTQIFAWRAPQGPSGSIMRLKQVEVFGKQLAGGSTKWARLTQPNGITLQNNGAATTLVDTGPVSSAGNITATLTYVVSGDLLTVYITDTAYVSDTTWRFNCLIDTLADGSDG
jgi:hypothetical protein